MPTSKLLSPILDRETETDRTRFHRGEWTLVRCRETGIVFLPNPPAYSELEEALAWETTARLERQRRQRDEPVLSRVSSAAKYLKRTLLARRNKMASLAVAEAAGSPRSAALTVMDIGCGSGELLVDICRALGDRGFRVAPIGIEVSRAIAGQARANLQEVGGTVLQSNAFDAVASLDRNSVQIIVMQSFLEHERHPLRLLKSLGERLSPNGAIVIKVPNFDCWNRVVRGNRWCGFRYPDHVNYFTPTTLGTLAAQAGFVVSRQTLADRFPTSDNMYAVLRKAA